MEGESDGRANSLWLRCKRSRSKKSEHTFVRRNAEKSLVHERSGTGELRAEETSVQSSRNKRKWAVVMGEQRERHGGTATPEKGKLGLGLR